MAQAPTGAHFQVGTAERQIGIVKKAFRHLKQAAEPSWANQELLSIVVSSRNITPLSSSDISPVFAATGRNDLINRIVNSVPSGKLDSPLSEDMKICNRLKLILYTRLVLLKLDAQSLLATAASKRLRANVMDSFKFNDKITLWSPIKKVWRAGFRYLSDSGRNAIIERGNRLLKVPIQWIRRSLVLTEDKDLLDSPEALSSQNVSNIPSSSVPMNRTVVEPATLESASKQKAEVSSSPRIDLNDNSALDVGSNGSSVSAQSRTIRSMIPKRYNLRSQSRNLFSHEAIRLDDIRILNCDFLVHCEDSLVDKDFETCFTAAIPDGGKLDLSNNTPSPNELFDEFGTFDLSRIPPRIYLQIPASRQAIREELNGLLQLDSAGIPIGRLCISSSPECVSLPKLQTTIVCKMKTNGSFKARICLRGDQQSLLSASFVSAPTASRDFLRWVIIFFVNQKENRLGMIDISKAFAQSIYLHRSERVAAVFPPCIGVNDEKWLGHVSTSHVNGFYESSVGSDLISSDAFHKLAKRFLLVLFRPLYGSRDAPLRWWLKLSSELQARGYIQFYSDCCLFGRYHDEEKAKGFANKSKLRFLVMLHADDMLFSGSNQECSRFLDILRIFDHSPVEFISIDSPLVFCAIEIMYKGEHVVEPSQEIFYSKISPLVKEEVYQNGSYIPPTGETN